MERLGGRVAATALGHETQLFGSEQRDRKQQCEYCSHSKPGFAEHAGRRLVLHGEFSRTGIVQRAPGFLAEQYQLGRKWFRNGPGPVEFSHKFKRTDLQFHGIYNYFISGVAGDRLWRDRYCYYHRARERLSTQ